MPKLAVNDQEHFPAWSETQKYGVTHAKVGGEVEPHFHDCNEYWIIISGEGDAMSEGKPYHLGPGDMLLTKAGDYHSLVVTKEMVTVYYYGVMPEHGRWGHLHEGVDLPWADHLASLKLEAAK
jgi:mannose-6-phosphate isomerase-like protein (cupin superfamily)